MKLAVLLVVGVIANVYGDEPEPIVGGNMASQGQFPHQVSLQENGYHNCGGSIISDRHIVTAAHCISQNSARTMTVVTGTNNLQNGGQVHRVKCIQVHEGYIPNIFANDIALITLAQPMTFHGLQRPISLASADYATGQTHCMISGWGRLGANANMPTMLQYVDTMALTRNDCVRAHPRTTAKQICTFNSYGKGACMGDSGGPLICNGQLVGVVSFGRPCAVGVPDVFTNVAYYRDWIQQRQQMC
ncbi:chymotrypsin-1-like [Odontomachus brunneus]|uniref:chymotrypsin-1-like n=1 Tax=Odontomachus brunneus TaxID=486640 RepID=UPI0013F22494|nr:chymotrypsin-1-like [Odontomachus brunneus]